MGGKGSGPKVKYHDEYHKKLRELFREYRKKNREILNLANREHIAVGEARRRVEGKKKRRKEP